MSARYKILVPLIFLSLAFAKPVKKVKVYLIGDSTMCYYEASRTPLAGWGMPFVHFFDSTVVIDNRARGGRSTRTFISEGRWEPIKNELKRGDYVLIQFGHNDEAKEERYKDRYTPVPDYKNNLVRFIKETRRKKATPVLITPVSRMTFKNGIVQQTHVEYTAAMFEVAKEFNVNIIDLDKRSRELYQRMGAENAKLLFMQLEPGEHPNYPEGQKDNTHFNDFGARKIAQLVLADLRLQKIGLVDRLVKPAAK